MINSFQDKLNTKIDYNIKLITMLPLGLINEIMKYVGPTVWPSIIYEKIDDLSIFDDCSYPGGYDTCAASSGIFNDIIIEKCTDISYFKYTEFGTITTKLANWIITHHEIILHEKDRWTFINVDLMTNDIIVKWLIKNPSLIRLEVFAGNSNPIAVEWMFNNNLYKIEYIYNGDMFKNTNTRVGKFILNKLEAPTTVNIKKLSLSENPIIIEWLINNPTLIDYKLFITNKSDRVVLWVIKNKPWSSIFYTNFVINPNKIATEYCMKNNVTNDKFYYGRTDLISRNYILNSDYDGEIDRYIAPYSIDIDYSWWLKTDEKSTSTIIQLLESNLAMFSNEIKKNIYEFISANTNPKVVKYLHDHPELINLHRFIENPNATLMDENIRDALVAMRF